MHHDPDRSWITDPDPDHPPKEHTHRVYGVYSPEPRAETKSIVKLFSNEATFRISRHNCSLPERKNRVELRIWTRTKNPRILLKLVYPLLPPSPLCERQHPCSEERISCKENRHCSAVLPLIHVRAYPSQCPPEAPMI